MRLALLIALLPALAWGQSLEDVAGSGSPVAARYQFGSTGGDWAVPAEAPAPTLDCRGDFSDGACTGLTGTPSGSPVAASSYWRPDGAGVGVGTAFDGASAISFSTGLISTDFTAAVRFRPTDATTTGDLLGSSSWRIYRLANNKVYFAITGLAAGGGTTALKCTEELTVGAEYVVVASLNSSGAMGCLVSGWSDVAGTAAYGPPVDGGTLSIGDRSGTPFTGTISRATAWAGWAATAEDRARMVRAQQAMQGSLGESLTVTRASTQSVVLGGPFVATVPANTLAIGQSVAEVYGAGTNLALWSEALDTAGVWSSGGTGGGTAVTSDSAVAPDGSSTADVVTNASGCTAACSRLQSISLTASVHTASFWIRATASCSTAKFGLYSGGWITATPEVLNGPGSVGGTGQMSLSGLSTTQWTRVKLTTSSATAAASHQLYVYPCGGEATLADKAVALWGAQLETGPIATPYIRTEGSAGARAATAASVPNPLTGNRWCVSATTTPGSASVANHGYVFSTRLVSDAANTMGLRYGNGTSSCEFFVYDSAASQRKVTFACDTNRHTYVVCNDAGALSVTVDGSLVGTSTTGGTGIVNHISTVLLGNILSTAYLGGAIEEVVFCNTATPDACR